MRFQGLLRKWLKLFFTVILVVRAESQVSLQFANFSSALTNLSDSRGVEGVNGLTWGIIIDTCLLYTSPSPRDRG